MVQCFFLAVYSASLALLEPAPALCAVPLAPRLAAGELGCLVHGTCDSLRKYSPLEFGPSWPFH